MMAPRAVLLIFSILIIGHHQVSSTRYTVEMFIDDVSFIPGARLVLTTAYNAWSLYNELKGMIPMNGTEVKSRLGELNGKLDSIDSEVKEISSDIHKLSGDVNDLKSTIADKVEIDQPSQIHLYLQLDKFDEQISAVEWLFDKLEGFNQTEHQLEAGTYEEFVNNILVSTTGQLSSALNVIHEMLTDERETKTTMLDTLTKKHLTNTLVCREGVSPFYKISHLYEAAMKAYTKAMVLNQFAIAYKKKQLNKPDGYKGELDILIKTFYSRTLDIVAKMKSVMSHASAAYWKCDALDLHENITYAKLGPIFQQYFLKEADAKDDHSKCFSTCDDRKDLVITDKCKSTFCKEQTKCSGVLVGCEKSKYHMNICLADPSSGRRYHYVEAKDKDERVYETFGQKNKCRKRIIANQKDWLLFACEYCHCTCLSHESIVDIDRYFSLKDVTSNVTENKVVTGVRFAKRNSILHIQIEEGTLMKEGVINKTSMSWKPVQNFSIYDKDVTYGVDYHIIEWEKRTVNLDDLESRGDKVLTGLRFKVVNKDALQLEIQVTPFDFNTGKLDGSKSAWISNDSNKERTEIDMNERDLPQANTYRHLDSEHNQFLKFTTSSFKNDVGQTVVPFIDLNEITTPHRTALSGAGLIHQANSAQSAGFLSFKLFNYNYAHHLGDN